ncbi:MAG: STAS domain-containing protein [Gemmatimonadetes bacterium]|nr:STAS domain-containing protein [Gemmatimonadota bacterium]
MRMALVGRGEEATMYPLPNADRVVLQAPERLVSEHRLDFRRDALERLSQAVSHGASRLTIDLRETREVDASGLGVLVLLQKRAREQYLTTCLTHTPPTVRHLLHLTQLESLFEFEE